MKNEHNKNEAKNESVETSCSGDSDTVTDNDDGWNIARAPATNQQFPPTKSSGSRIVYHWISSDSDLIHWIAQCGEQHIFLQTSIYKQMWFPIQGWRTWKIILWLAAQDRQKILEHIFLFKMEIVMNYLWMDE